MTSKTATKIFTVLALAGGGTAMADTAAPRTLASGRPACGNLVASEGKSAPTTAELAQLRACKAGTVTVATAPPAPTPVAARVTPLRTRATPLLATAITTTPPAAVRTLPSGRPACGNVASKGPRPVCAPVAPAVTK